MKSAARDMSNGSHPDLPASGFVRIAQIIGPGRPIPVSRSTLYVWIQTGIFPAPVPIGAGRIKGFRVEDVRAFIAKPMPSAVPNLDAEPDLP